MSKVVVSLPDGAVGRSVTGGILALVCYVLEQLLCAYMINCGLLPEEQLYPAVCVCAAVASFLGCGYSVVKGKGSAMLPVSAVVVVFLALTVAAGLITGGGELNVERGLVGVGLSMAAGGLASALVGDTVLKQGKSRRRRQRRVGK